MKYILADDGRTPVPEHDLVKWANFLETGNRIVKQDSKGVILVSTVFLGLDYAFNDENPVLWETMIFGGSHNGYQMQYTSYEQALLGHEVARRLALPKETK